MITPSNLVLALGVLFVALLLTANWLVWELPYTNHSHRDRIAPDAASHGDDYCDFKRVA
jgi:hypothetical protein